MKDVADIITTTEGILGPVSIGTVVATFVIALFLSWAFFTKILPRLKQGVEERVKRRIEKEKQADHIQKLDAWREEHMKFSEELHKALKDVGKSVDTITNMLERQNDANITTMSVLLDIVECMRTGADADKCAERAQGRINKYFLSHGMNNQQ